MGWVKFILAMSIVYIAHSHYVLSDSYVQDYLNEHNTGMISDPKVTCSNYSDDVIVNMRHRTTKGGFKLFGGKNKICDYMQSGQHVLGDTTQAESEHFVNMKVTSSFPWLSATAYFEEQSQIQVSNLGTIYSKTHEIIHFKRGLSGLQIVEVTSTGGVSY